MAGKIYSPPPVSEDDPNPEAMVVWRAAAVLVRWSLLGLFVAGLTVAVRCC